MKTLDANIDNILDNKNETIEILKVLKWKN